MWEKLKATGKPILLYGMGDGAEKIAAELKKRAADTLDKVLFELSCTMKNAFSRSDA